MRITLKLTAVLALVLASSTVPTAERLVPSAVAPAFSAIGPLAFAPTGVLFAADRQAAAVFALTLGDQASSGTPGTASVPALDQKIAGLLGTAADQITITDLAVHPTSKNSFVSVMRGQGTGAQPALVRVDGAGKVDLVALATVEYTRVALPNPAAATTTGRGGRTQSVTDMSLVDGRLFVAGLSNEEFASKLWSVPYPFTTADRGASVEIYHGNHGAWETRAPVMTFLPYEIGSTPLILAAYTCTPLVKFERAKLATGQKVVGHTMMELGAGNQPLDMIAYANGGESFLLLANSRHGVLKVPTAQFVSAPAIESRVGGTAGEFEPVVALTGVEQLDRLDDHRLVSIARAQDGSRSLSAAPLP
jgi:hypothetical protein